MKNKVLTTAALSCLLLAGCSTVSTAVTDGSEVIMTIGNTTYTKNDEYQLIKRINGPSLTLQAAQRLIYDAEIDDQQAAIKEAEELYETYASSSDTFEETLKAYGYADKQDYIDNVLVPSVLSQKLLEKYFEEAKTSIEEEFKPVKAAVIECDSQDNAQKALEALKNGEDAQKVGEQYAMDGAVYKGKDAIISTASTTLPTRLINTLYETSKDGVIDEVFTNDTSTDDVTYYVVKLVSKDYDENLEDIISALSSNSTIAADCTVYYLSKYEFEVHDQYIFDYFKVNYPQYLVTRPDLSE